MSAAATAAGYLYASGRLSGAEKERRKKQREDEQKEWEQRDESDREDSTQANRNRD